MNKLFTLIAACFLLPLTSAVAEETIQDRLTHSSFPAVIQLDDQGKTYKLEATGVSTRKKFFVKVYSVAHYMQDPINSRNSVIFEEILKSRNTKQLTIRWLRAIDSNKIQEGYRESLQSTIGRSESPVLQTEIDKFSQFFNEGARKNDEHVLRWMADGSLIVVINGKEQGTIHNGDFAKSVWEIWLGQKSVVNRNQLVERISKG